MHTLKLLFCLFPSSPHCLWPASGGWTPPRRCGTPLWCIPHHWRSRIGGGWTQCRPPWQPGPTMIEACSGPISQTRPRAGAGRITARSDQSGRAPFSGILTQAPPFRNRSLGRINWCYCWALTNLEIQPCTDLSNTITDIEWLGPGLSIYRLT